MIFLRLLAFMLGSLLLLVPPLFAGANGPLRMEDEILTVTMSCILIATNAASFFFIAFAGHKMKRSAPRRVVGGMLLAIPLVTGVLMVTEIAARQGMYLCVAMFCLAATLFVSFVYPGERSHKQRPMRKRDIADHYLEPTRQA